MGYLTRRARRRRVRSITVATADDRDRRLPTQTVGVSELPVMAPLRRAGYGPYPLETDGEAVKIDPRMAAHSSHYYLGLGGI